MGEQMEKFKTILACCLVLAVGACSKKSSGGGATVTVTTYYQSDNVCYARSTNNEVDFDKCDNVTYYFENGSCFEKDGNDEVSLSKCEAGVNQYFYNDGGCYDKNSNDYVNDSKCNSSSDDDDDDDDDDNSSNGRYATRSNSCIDTANGWQVDPAFCTAQNSSGVNCSGNYVWYDYTGRPTYVRCSANDCDGFVLFNESTGRLVKCK